MFPSEWCSDDQSEIMSAPIRLSFSDTRHALTIQPFDSATLDFYKHGERSLQADAMLVLLLHCSATP